MRIKPIARIYTDFTEKFGIPRQSGLVGSLVGKIVFEPEYRSPEALRGLEGFSHIWIIWQFSETAGLDFRPTVRPPRLGGNKRVGVFASRSPFRPNSLGLSCVRLEKIAEEEGCGSALIVSGVDILDSTPIYDIKPYLPLSDCRTDALEGYTAETKTHSLETAFPAELLSLIPEQKRNALIGVLESDPRPGYDDSPSKEYGIYFAGYDIGFRVNNNVLTVFRVTQRK